MVAPRRLRIAYLVHDYHLSGGHSRYVAELARRFAADHDVHVFANRIEADRADGIHFHKVPAWRANALTTVLSFAVPVTFAAGGDFDIIHSQGFCGFRGNVFTAHICNRAWHQGLEKLAGGATFREAVFNKFATVLEHGTYRFARHSSVIAISQRVARDIVEFYHCPAPIHIIHHGVDLATFSPETRLRWRPATRAQYGFAEDEMIFLYVGDLRKGAARAIEALARIPHGKLALVSRSPIDAYERAADNAGVGDRVRFLGPTNEVHKVYAAADALLLPSPYDAFAMVVSEAMACGLPVVVSREAGASELIQPGENGLILEDAASDAELAEHMQSLSEDPDWAAKLGCAARKSVESLSWDAIAAETMRVYEEVLARRG